MFHMWLTKCYKRTTLNIYDGLFINPLIGKKKVGDFKDDIILNSYTVLINNYYPQISIHFSTLHTEMKYAGPKLFIMLLCVKILDALI